MELQTYTKNRQSIRKLIQFGLWHRFSIQVLYQQSSFWTTDLFGATDDGTELKLTNIPEGNRILSMSRKDYSISTGVRFLYYINKTVQLLFAIVWWYWHY